MHQFQIKHVKESLTHFGVNDFGRIILWGIVMEHWASSRIRTFVIVDSPEKGSWRKENPRRRWPYRRAAGASDRPARRPPLLVLLGGHEQLPVDVMLAEQSVGESIKTLLCLGHVVPVRMRHVLQGDEAQACAEPETLVAVGRGAVVALLASVDLDVEEGKLLTDPAVLEVQLADLGDELLG